MDIVMVANYVSGLEGKDNNRFSYLAKMFASEHQVELITTDFSHIKKAHREVDETLFPFKVTVLHEPGYPKNISLKRFYSQWVFGSNVAKYLKTRKKPDVIYCAVPTLDAARAAADYAHKNKVRFIIDVQDLWPEAFKMVLWVPVISDLMFLPMTNQANYIYRQADRAIAVSRTYAERISQAGGKCSDVQVVFLGTRLDDFDANAGQYRVTDKPENELWLAYCGTLGSSYDLISVFRALEQLRQRGITPPKFIVMGDGPKKAEFESYAREKQLNVQFTGRLPYAQMCGLLSSCDIAVNPIAKGSAGSIVNKHGDYAASGKPVLNTQESQEYRDLVEAYHMGFNCVNGSSEDMADKLAMLIRDPELRREMGENARRCAQEKFDRNETYKQIMEIVTGEPQLV